MHQKQRHFEILKDVNHNLISTVPDLVKATGASEATVRRDIILLEKTGKLKKIRGGAETLTHAFKQNFKGNPFQINKKINMEKTGHC